jgi:hypothetical protein
MNWPTAVLALFFAVGATTAGAEVPTPQASAKKGARIAIEPAGFDFGQALQNKTLNHDFVLRNVGDEPLRIEDVRTTCGCTAALPNARVVPPGGQTRLQVSLQTRTSEGRLEKGVSIRSNDPTRNVLEIKLTVTVVKPAESK